MRLTIVKWFATIGIIGSMLLTAYNLYPLNLYVAIPATLGWMYVSFIWNDKALIALNFTALSIYFLGILNYVGITL